MESPTVFLVTSSINIPFKTELRSKISKVSQEVLRPAFYTVESFYANISYSANGESRKKFVKRYFYAPFLTTHFNFYFQNSKNQIRLLFYLTYIVILR